MGEIIWDSYMEQQVIFQVTTTEKLFTVHGGLPVSNSLHHPLCCSGH